MGNTILINLPAYRSGGDNNQSPAEGIATPGNEHSGLKTLRELAVFRFTCRKCRDAPCIAVCPSKALEKDQEGIISRAVNLCISCKSCLVICPFGTLMTDFFRFKTDRSELFNISEEETREKFIGMSRNGTVQSVEAKELHDELVHKLNDDVMVREYVWDKI